MENLEKEFSLKEKMFEIKEKNENYYRIEDKEGRGYKVSLNVLQTYDYTEIGSKILISEYFLMTNNMICKFDAFILFLLNNLDRFSLDKDSINDYISMYSGNKYEISKNKSDFIKNTLSIIYVIKLVKDKSDLINFFQLKIEFINLFKEEKFYKIISGLDLLGSIILRNFHLNTTSEDMYEIIHDFTYNKRMFDLEHFIYEILKKNEIILKKVPF